MLSFILTLQAELKVKGSIHGNRIRRHGVFGFNAIDSIFVIHLESRDDRLQQINGVMESLGVSKHKIVNGVPHSCGALGCSLTHIMALSECVHSNATTCAVIEDDFELSGDPKEANAAVELFFMEGPPSWEVLMLSSNIYASLPSEHFFLDVIQDAQTTSGYIVHTSYAPTLLHNFLYAAYNLDVDCPQIYAIDQTWKRLQRSGKWYALKPLIGKQTASYSDIEKRNVDYQVRRRLARKPSSEVKLVW